MAARLPLLLSLFASIALVPAVRAQTVTPRPEAVTPELKAERERELKRAEEQLQKSQAENAALAAEIAQIRGDRARLNSDLVATSQRVRDAEARAQTADQRLAALTLSEEAMRKSLAARRGTIVEVLAALQRIGRKPPPAVLVRPEDMLQAVRTSMFWVPSCPSSGRRPRP